MTFSFLHWPIAIISTFSSFPSIYWSKVSKNIPSSLSTWTGSKFKVLNINSNLGTILEIWHEKVYGDLSELQSVEQPIIIDIGANIGAFTVYASSKLKNPKIYAYEPELNNFGLLQANIALNNLTGQSFGFRKAVCGKIGKVLLSIVGESSGKNSVAVDQHSGKTQEVECVTLDSIFKENSLSHCNLLKIDCEGSEYDLLFNTSKETLAKVHMMILEWHIVPGHSLEELTSFLLSAGFEVERSQNHETTLVARRPL